MSFLRWRRVAQLDAPRVPYPILVTSHETPQCAVAMAARQPRTVDASHRAWLGRVPRRVGRRVGTYFPWSAVENVLAFIDLETVKPL